MTLLYILLSIIALSILVPYVIGPVFVRYKLQQYPRFRVFHFDELSEDAVVFFEKRKKEMEDLGFTFAGYQVWENDPNRIFFSLLVHLENGDAAMVAHAVTDTDTVTDMENENTGAKTSDIRYVEFSTEFEDGTELNTSNNPEFAFPFQLPEKRMFPFPEIEETKEIYHIHRIFRKHFQSSGASILPETGREFESVRESILKDFSRHVESEYFYQEEGTGLFRPTWKGAVLMTWKMAWPVNRIRKAAIKRNARDFLDKIAPE